MCAKSRKHSKKNKAMQRVQTFAQTRKGSKKPTSPPLKKTHIMSAKKPTRHQPKKQPAKKRKASTSKVRTTSTRTLGRFPACFEHIRWRTYHLSQSRHKRFGGFAKNHFGGTS